MRYINKFFVSMIIITAVLLSGCGYKYDIPYSTDSNISGFRMVDFETSEDTVSAFAEKLCIVSGDVDAKSIEMNEDTAAALFDVTNKDTIYAKNVHEKMYPASLTKIMTFIVAIKHGELDQVLTASPNACISDYSVQKIGLKDGDQMTLEQALNIMLVYSANDVANLIAEGIGGSIENFVAMMNDEALSLGCTETHFVNANGLTNEEHYTSPYDLYLMMNEAIQFESFKSIIAKQSYETTYYNVAGNEEAAKVESTNLYLSGQASSPGGITIVGGKTGTTNAAGHCLIVLSKNASNQTYISIVMKSESRDGLYKIMNSMLTKGV